VRSSRPLARAGIGSQAQNGPVADALARFRRAFGWQRVCLGAVLVWSLLPLLMVAAKALDGQGPITGGYGLHPGDQFQYLSWIRQAGEHGLIANRLDIGPAGHVFLQPMFLLSGIAWRAGASLPLTFLIWIPISALVMFAGFRAYVLRWFGDDGRAAAAALVLAVFFSAPLTTLIDQLGMLPRSSRILLSLTSADVFAGRLTWGYPATALAMGLMAFSVLGTERIIESSESGSASRRSLWRTVAWTGAAAALSSWLHPWQGATLVLMIASLSAWARFRRPVWPLSVVAAAALLPIVYYWVLPRIDPAWAIANRQNSLPWPPVWPIAVALGPLALCALLGVPLRPRTAGERLLILWPAVAVVTYVLVRSYPFHAMNAVTLPLAVLAVRAWPRLTRFRGLHPLPCRWALALAAVGAVCVPGVVFSWRSLHAAFRSPTPAYLLTATQRQALEWLQSHGKPGGVASEQIIGATVPVYTDRASWLGSDVWTRDSRKRNRLITRILTNMLPAKAARSALLHTGASYLLLTCSDHLPARDLPPGARLAARFGCVRVIELQTRTSPPSN
jgi:hypothetical protein